MDFERFWMDVGWMLDGFWKAVHDFGWMFDGF